MKTLFDNFFFHGTFRDYQQSVLQKADKYLLDKRIHIVAAPGSGKTILGLELIRRLGEPVLILTPTITIRTQWQERFRDGFMPVPDKIDEVFSFSLKNPKLLTAVTYQALHAMYNKKTSTEIDELESEDETAIVKNEDYSQFDLMAVIKETGIKTICLDEAHHLKNEWQKTLANFLTNLLKDTVIISLTATPPYDSSGLEWKRYMAICGEIDAEIQVPQLVKQKTLCPHQDYIYFSYPTKEECELLNNYKSEAYKCTFSIINGSAFHQAISQSGFLDNYRHMEELLFEHAEEFSALLTLAEKAKIKIPGKLQKLLLAPLKLRFFSLKTAQVALEFLISSPDLFGKAAIEEIKTELRYSGFLKDQEIILEGDPKIKRMLNSSLGKMSGTNTIVNAEIENLGTKLRMLILTDFIKKDSLQIIGSDVLINTMGTIPIFESLRRTNRNKINIAVLTGTVVIVPVDIVEAIKEIAVKHNVEIKTKPLAKVPYCQLLFGASNKSKVVVMTAAFEKELIQVLIGTKALLGEGWDSPGINSLILASFVGSFVLSNQMRGRAIRIDKNDANKTANIWHLVTVEPPFLFSENAEKIVDLAKENFTVHNKIFSEDYQILERRFRMFMAPAYHYNTIESGIDRIDVIKPPFDEAGFKRINREMLQLASTRSDVSAQWNSILSAYQHPVACEAFDVPKAVKPTNFLLMNLFFVSMLGVLVEMMIRLLVVLPNFADSLPMTIIFYIIITGMVFLIIRAMEMIIKFISPKNTVKTLANCLLTTMKTLNLIESQTASLVFRQTYNGLYRCLLKDASDHDNSLFDMAINEMLTAIDNPRYVIIRKPILFRYLSYANSYACPTVISTNKENANEFLRNIKRQAGNFELIYTRSVSGRKHLVKCKKRSYLNRNEVYLNRMKVLDLSSVYL